MSDTYLAFEDAQVIPPFSMEETDDTDDTDDTERLGDRMMKSELWDDGMME